VTTEFIPIRFSFNATNSLASSQYRLAKLDTSNADGVVVATDATAPIVGSVQNNPTAGHAAEISLVPCIAKVVASAAISVGDKITATTGGKAVTTTTIGDWFAGLAIDAAAADGDVIRFLQMPGRVGIGAASAGWGTPTGAASSFTNWDGTTSTAATIAAELAKLITVLKTQGILAA
jgi:hypothetical protein